MKNKLRIKGASFATEFSREKVAEDWEGVLECILTN